MKRWQRDRAIRKRRKATERRRRFRQEMPKRTRDAEPRKKEEPLNEWVMIESAAPLSACVEKKEKAKPSFVRRILRMIAPDNAR